MSLPPVLQSPFADSSLPAQLRWHCPPSRWRVEAATQTLHVEPDAPTDFWQRTHYGFRVDSGHFLHAEVSGDFVLSVLVRFRPVHQYDQAGVMVRVSEGCWLKAAVEFEPGGPARLGAVVTNHGYSDWSTQNFPPGPGETWLRVRREADDYLVEASADGQAWGQLRMTHLHEGRRTAVAAGVYACSPKGTGFAAEFTRLVIRPGRVEEVGSAQ